MKHHTIATPSVAVSALDRVKASTLALLVVLSSGLAVSCAKKSANGPASASADASSGASSESSSPSVGGLFGGGSSSGEGDGEPLAAPAPIDDLKLSSVTVRGLRSAGLTSSAAVAEWFNAVPTTEDIFFGPMVDELDRCKASAPSMAELKLSAPTLEVLTADGVTTPAGVAGFDRKRLKDSRKANDLCRNEIASAFQRVGWTVLRAQITNTAKATQLTVNGGLIGPISESQTPVWRRFVVKAPGPESAASVIATLGVDVLSPANGMPVARWFKDVVFERGGEARISIDVGRTPAPTIGFSAKTPLSPASVYAGDEVTLTCHGGDDSTVWFAFVRPNRLTPDNYSTPPATTETLAGLPAWFRLRNEAERTAEPRQSLLDEPGMQPIVIGRGATMAWRPEYESPGIRIGALVRGRGGFWAFASRSIAVADLRPGLWIMPLASIDPESIRQVSRLTASLEPNPLNIYVTHAILGSLAYQAGVDQAVQFDLRLDEYRDASLPLDSVTVDFGDGSAPERVDGASARQAVLSHAFGEAGDYAVTVVSRDVLGFERRHGTTIRVVAELPEEVQPPVPALPVPMVRISETPAESSFELFRRAARRFANTVVARTQPTWDGKRVGIAHIHDAKDQGLIDVMDGSLVQALLEADANVYEREPLFQLAIDARGFIDSSKQVVPDQGGKVPEALMQRAADVQGVSPDLTLKLLDRIGTAAVPDVEAVIEYKLKRAEVALLPAGAMVIRTARIFAWVRVHERSTMRILFDGDVAVELGGTIVAADASSVGSPWDAYPDGYMLREKSKDRAIESIDVEPAKAADPDAVPAPAAPPAAVPDSPGALLKGLFGG
jgi:hypothetical protein